MLKKIIIFCICVCMVFVISFVVYYRNSSCIENIKLGENKSQESDSFSTQELEDMKYVNDSIKKLMSKKSYKNLELEDKVSEVKMLLKELKKQKYIKDFHYDSDSYMFSYTYANGVLGGIMVKDFDPMLN